MMKFAVHYPKIAFSLKKEASERLDLKTDGFLTQIDCIALVYGSELANELLKIETDSNFPEFSVMGNLENKM